jgi:hypothetical protein
MQRPTRPPPEVIDVWGRAAVCRAVVCPDLLITDGAVAKIVVSVPTTASDTLVPNR